MSSTNSAPLGFAQLMGNNKYSDLKLLCQGQEFNVHKAIVCPQSVVFALECDSQFKEGLTSTIKIEEFDVGTVSRMVEYLYTRAYSDGPDEQESEDVPVSIKVEDTITPAAELRDLNDQNSQQPAMSVAIKPLDATAAIRTRTLQRHVRMNAIADYYDFPPLKQLANTKILHILKTSWSADGFSDVVKNVFESTSDVALREIMASVAAAHMQDLLERQEFTTLVLNEFTVTTVQKMIKSSKAMEERYAQEVKAVKHQLLDTKARLKDTEARLRTTQQLFVSEESQRQKATQKSNQAIANINSCVNILSRTSCCRNCEAEFSCYFEASGSTEEPQYLLRCEECWCRHYN